MKAFLMYKGRDFNVQEELPSNEKALVQDLELNTLFKAMALEDKLLFEVAKRAVLSGLGNDLDTILYRQNILKDCIKNASVVRDIYATAIEAIEGEKKIYWGVFSKFPPAILSRSIEVLQLLVGTLTKLRNLADQNAYKFESEGFTRLFAMLKRELDDAYFASIQNHLQTLKFRDGVPVSVELGKGNKGTEYVLRKPPVSNQSWLEQIFAKQPPAYIITIADRDDAGAKALSELKDRGIHLAANALAQSVDHIVSFYKMLQTELAFYMGCLNLHEQLVEMGNPISLPIPRPPDERKHSFQGLYDVCLALTKKHKIVGNDVKADDKNLVIITGANQGGKSTFLRSVGLAQLMMQCGMFAPAISFSANLCDGLFTHYKREEDTSMKSGKLDEELSRMSDIADRITANSIVLFNESFAATNEREGSEIASQIVRVLVEKRIKVFFVTHQYEFARGFYDRNLGNAIFLRAERKADGGRTFRINEGEPLKTSYGKDLYRKIFETGNLPHPI